MLDQDSPAVGRFDKSFLIHMIKDFFIVLSIVTVLEFSLKAALVYYKFSVNGSRDSAVVADALAENVRSIMRNEGGPVAARTMYPILDKNWSDLGYTVAIEPSEVTIRSIEAGFDFTPRGIPAEPWPEGQFRSATVEITAETYCLGCHSEAEVGQVLGVVTVRNYLARDFALWLNDVQLSGALAVAKIVLHSVLLFLILRARLEPLLRLRSVVSNLARAYGSLTQRAEIRSADEFGVLARDLNLFLDRIGTLVSELDLVLSRVIRVNDDIVSVQGDLRDRIDRVVTRARRLERDAMLTAKREPRLSKAWFDAIRESVSALDAALVRAGDAPQATGLLDSLRAVVSDAETQLAGSERLFEGLAELGDQTEALKDVIAEMTRLEERMKSIVEVGTQLVAQLRPAPAT
ncbi:methyl-accepting chemotaxis protein [Paracoccaceae bacterium Fryx2]|nr:methyl-accepting chemotaxis protein [Paracoccaceae bacterium Fryx2]